MVGKKALGAQTHSVVAKNGKKPASSSASQLGIRTRSQAIRRKCVDDCCCGNSKIARNCRITDCELWPYRLGRNYKSKEEMVADMKRCKELTIEDEW